MLALFGLCALAGTPRWQVDRWTMRDGLPQNSVTDLLQSADGEIWLTTFGGIARFDGIEFRSFTPANTEGLRANRFVALAESPDGTLWFASSVRGATRYRAGRFEPVGKREPLNDLAVDGQGRVWAASQGAFIELSADPPRRIPVTEGVLQSLLRLPDGRVVGSGTGMSPRCPTDPGCLELPVPPPSGNLGRLGLDIADRPWWFDAYGAYVLHDDEWVPRTQTMGSGSPPGFTFTWRGDSFWVQGGELNGDALPTLGLPRIDAPIRSALVDDEAGLWLGLGRGLMRIQSTGVTLHHGPISILGVARDAGGRIWTSACPGLRIIDDTGAGARPLPLPEFPGELHHRHCSPVWAGDDGDVFTMMHDGTHSSTTVLRIRGSDVSIVADLPERPPHAVVNPFTGPWFVHDGILYGIPRDGEARIVTTAEALGGAKLTPVRSGPDGAVWVVVDLERLVELRDGEPVRTVALPAEADVRDVLERGSEIWISTYGAGLLAVRGETLVAAITREQGLCDHAVSHIYDLGDGYLWFSTNRGLGRVSETDLQRARDDPNATVRCSLVDTGEVNGASGVIGRRNHLWMPTLEGLAEIDPRDVPDQPPRLVLREVAYGETNLLAQVEPTRVRGQHTLTVRYAGLQYADPRAVRYQYRLLGRDDEAWSAPTATRELHWHLPPGDYRVEVRATGPSGLTTPPLGISFVRAPEIWETEGFQIGVPLVVLGSIVIILWTAWRTSARHNAALQTEIRVQELREDTLRGIHEGQRLETLGRLSGGIAHDFNNVLLIVSSHASELVDHGEEGIRAVGRSLLDTVDRAVNLTRRLLVLGRQEKAEPETLDLGLAIRRYLPLLKRVIREDVGLLVETGASAWVRIDPARLDQIVMNLVVNASDAIEGRGQIVIDVAADDDNWAVLRVRDDGQGIDEAQLENIFEPYFTTKRPGRGTGLGLATVHSAALEAGGRVEAHSDEGAGTTMTVLLPRMPAPTAPVAGPTTPRSSRPGDGEPVPDGLAVLVVEDQPDVARSLGRLVWSLGLVPHVANSAPEALEILGQEAIDLVLTDVVMPEASGPEMVARVRQEHPDLAVLFMSGHAPSILDELGPELRGVPLLRKPFARAELAEAVADALHTRRRATRG
ncbi:MAG: ATP-binding protein [Myxococcota bacterium]